jgi:hypothetical protein
MKLLWFGDEIEPHGACVPEEEKVSVCLLNPVHTIAQCAYDGSQAGKVDVLLRPPKVEFYGLDLPCLIGFLPFSLVESTLPLSRICVDFAALDPAFLLSPMKMTYAKHLPIQTQVVMWGNYFVLQQGEEKGCSSYVQVGRGSCDLGDL